jgi:hypothetical protein
MTKDEKIVKDLIDEMFRIAGYDVKYEDIKDREDAWYTDWTMTEQQYDQWIEFGSEYIRKNKRLRKEKAKHAMAWFALNYGLKFSDL